MPMRADAGGGQIQRQRRAQPAGAHHQHARGLQLRLADAAHVLQQDVPRVAADFVFGEIEVHGDRIGDAASRDQRGTWPCDMADVVSSLTLTEDRCRTSRTITRWCCSPAGRTAPPAWPGRSTAIRTWRPSASPTASATRWNWTAAHRSAPRSPRCWPGRLGPDHTIDLAATLGGLGATALTSDTAIAMTEEGLPNTFVPGRNLLFLTCAAALAYRRGLRRIVAGMCETDYSGYPDCRDDTIKAMQLALNLGMQRRFVLETPLMWRDKAATWALAHRLGGDRAGRADPRRDP